MKKTLLVLLFLTAVNLSSQVQYKYYEVPSGTTNDLKDISPYYLFDQYDYFICGKDGTLLYIYNADSNCKIIPTNTNIDLNKFLFTTIYTGSAYSHPHFIFSNNGFYFRSPYDNLILVYSGFSYNLNTGLFLLGKNNNYSPVHPRFISAGSNGIILKKLFYAEADTAWLQVPSGTTNNLNSIITYYDYLFKNCIAWIAGDNGTILRTNDTGNTWVTQATGATKNLKSIIFRTIDSGFAVGDGGIILSTTNGGNNWIQKNSGTINNLNCIYSSGNSDMYIAGDKVILLSTNRGNSWDIDTLAPKYNLNSIYLLYSNVYQKYIPFFVGEQGKIYKKLLDTTFHPNVNITLDGNNISAWFTKYGVFDQDFRYMNTPGFEWPKGSGKFAVFTAGLSISAYSNNQLRQVCASYKGEFSPGYCENGNFKTNTIFKYYKVTRGDNANNNWDWANWGLMVPYGAPFIDVNHNGIYEPAIDTPGVSNAAQTIFYCMTDADSNSHNAGEGFGGGTLPLGAEVHLTAWVYDTPGLQDVQFLNYTVINKSVNIWKRTYFGLFSDADLGDANDDYSGCDSSLKLTFCYNADNYDNVYGYNPPAIGFAFLSGPVIKNQIADTIFGMTSSISFYKHGSMCESDPNGEPHSAHMMFSGFKKDSTCFLDPTFTPFRKTKFTYSGDPETNTGWTRLKGCVFDNCNLDSIGTIMAPAPVTDIRFTSNSGAENLRIAPGDTQRICIAQLIARGTSNLNSVTELKNLCRNVRLFYESNFPFVVVPTPPPPEIPGYYSLSQNYPNPFNNQTRIKFEVPLINGSATNSTHITIRVYDMLGREIATLANGEYTPGKYELTFEGKNFASGIYFYRLTTKDFYSVKRMALIK